MNSSRFRTIAAAAFAIATFVLVCQLPAAPGPAKRVGFSILEDWDKGEDLKEVAKDFALFRQLGITTWRGSFGWDDYEPTRGRYDFAWLHDFADLAAEYGITLRPYIGYTPAWAGGGGSDKDAWNDPPRDIEDWRRFVRALASSMRRHRNLVSYEIYNEENVPQWWDGTVGAYSAVLRRAAQAIKTVSPEKDVLLGGLVWPDVSWVQHVCTDGRDASRFAVLPFHAYPETWTPPDVDVERYLGPHFEDGFVRAADAACGRKPIWINETGFATVEGRTERDQADWWTRAIGTFAAAPRVAHIGVYEIKDLKANQEAIGGAPNYHLGITRADRSKKMAFRTIQGLVALLRGPLVVEDGAVRIAPGATGLYEHAFARADGRLVVFVWTKAARQVVDISVPRRGARAIEHRVDGSSAEYRNFDGRTLSHVAIEPGNSVVFEIVP